MKVVVVGGGPAGLAAAEALADRGRGEVEVELWTLEPHLGGNASAFVTADGRVVEQGQHCWFGFYREMAALLARAGVDIEEVSTSGLGRMRVWEDRDGQTHDLYLGPSSPRALVSGLSYTGMTAAEKFGFALFFLRVFAKIAAGPPESWDDQCFSSWAIEHGLPASFTATRLWRASREGQFNWPGEASAYGIAQAIRQLGRDFTTSEFRFPRGAMGDLWWDPIARRVEALGGAVRTGVELTGLVHDGRRLRGLRVRRLDAPADALLDAPFPVVEGSEEVRDGFDAAVLAVPPAALQAMFRRDPGLLALGGMRRVARMGTVAPLGLHVWHRAAPVDAPRTFVLGLDEPLGIAVDVKPLHDAYRRDPRFGAVLHFVGPETGFEGWGAEPLLERSLASLRRVRGYEGFDLDGVVDFELVRHGSPHRRYWNSEPGSLRFKPHPHEALENLWLAGDWVRSELDFPCMETAIRSGRAAALDLLRARRSS